MAAPPPIPSHVANIAGLAVSVALAGSAAAEQSATFDATLSDLDVNRAQRALIHPVRQ
jgi:hypothetical protein